MVIRCPSCGAENPDGAQFCNLCLSTVGFESPEYPTPPEDTEGFMDRYPSSFGPGAPKIEPKGVTEAKPMDIGEYGVRSGEAIKPEASAVESPGPVDIGEYGVRSGAPIYAEPGELWMAERTIDSGYVPHTERKFDWVNAITKCVTAAILAAFLTSLFELFIRATALSVSIGQDLSFRKQLILIIFLAFPFMLAAFLPGYWVKRYGAFLGIFSVILLGFVFRPLYYSVICQLAAQKFPFLEIAFNKENLAFLFLLYIPLGALVGWLGQKYGILRIKI